MLAAIRRRWQLVLGVTLCCMLVAGLAIGTRMPLYLSHAIVRFAPTEAARLDQQKRFGNRDMLRIMVKGLKLNTHKDYATGGGNDIEATVTKVKAHLTTNTEEFDTILNVEFRARSALLATAVLNRIMRIYLRGDAADNYLPIAKGSTMILRPTTNYTPAYPLAWLWEWMLSIPTGLCLGGLIALWTEAARKRYRPRGAFATEANVLHQ